MIADEWKVFFDSEAQTASSLDTELMFWRSVGFWPVVAPPPKRLYPVILA